MQRSSPLTQRSIEFGARTVLRKLHALSPMSPQDMALIEQLAGLTPHRPGAELVVEGKGVPTPRLVVNGWAARIRTLPDGRRQILGFVLPGDGIGLCHRGRPLAAQHRCIVDTGQRRSDHFSHFCCGLLVWA